MSDLPSRKEAAASLGSDLYENGVVFSIVEAYASGRLFDGEAFNIEAALVQARKDGADEPWKVALIIDAATGVLDEK